MFQGAVGGPTGTPEVTSLQVWFKVTAGSP